MTRQICGFDIQQRGGLTVVILTVPIPPGIPSFLQTVTLYDDSPTKGLKSILLQNVTIFEKEGKCCMVTSEQPVYSEVIEK